MSSDYLFGGGGDNFSLDLNSDYSGSSGDYSSVFDNPNWFGSQDWSSNLDQQYDPLSDTGASTTDITSYLDKYLSNPNLYSLSSGDTGLGTGSYQLGLSSPNVLGQLLSNNPVGDASAANPMSKLLASLQKLLGGSGKGNPQISGLLNALMAVMAQRKGIKNGAQRFQNAQNTASRDSQRSLGGIRGGLSNMNTAARDPMSYVQAAPPIVRREQ